MADRQRDWPLRHDHDDHARHQAQRGHAGPDRGAGRGTGRLGGRARPAARRWRRCPTPASASLLWQAVVGAWPASRERLHQYAEKAMREAADHTTWTDPDADVRGRRARRCRRGVRLGRGAGASSTAWSPSIDEPGRSNGLADQAARPDGPGRARRLPGHRAVGPQPGRPRQPAAGRLRRPGRAARRRRPPQAARHRRRRCGCGATGPSCSRRTPRSPPPARPPTTCWPSTAAARSPSSPGCRSGSTGAAAGATRRWTSTVAWRDVLTDRVVGTPARRRARATCRSRCW